MTENDISIGDREGYSENYSNSGKGITWMRFRPTFRYAMDKWQNVYKMGHV